MNPYGLLELSEPVSFEPVGPVTSVFYDAKNKQVTILFANNGKLFRINKFKMFCQQKRFCF